MDKNINLYKNLYNIAFKYRNQDCIFLIGKQYSLNFGRLFSFIPFQPNAVQYSINISQLSKSYNNYFVTEN